MVNLIEKERREHQELLKKVEKENKRLKGARVVSYVAGIIASAPNFYQAFFNPESSFIGESTEGALMAFLCYQAGTSGHPWVTKPLTLLNPINIYDNFVTALGGIMDDRTAYPKFTIKHRGTVEGTIDEDRYDATAAVYEGNDEVATDVINRLLDVAPDINFRPNLLVRLVTDTCLLFKKPTNSEYLENLIDAAHFARNGRKDLAEWLLNTAIETSKNKSTEFLTALCIYANYLERTKRPVKARNTFKKAIKSIENFDSAFQEIPGSKNIVYVHNSKVIGGSFVFKTGDDTEEIRSEHAKTEFVYNTMGNSRKRFVAPLALVEIDGRTFSVTKRVGNASLKEHIDNRDFDIARGAARKGLESVLLLHLKTSGDLESARKAVGEEDICDFAEKKILRNIAMQPYSNPEDTELAKGIFSVSRGINSFRGVAHRDFHPGNLIINQNIKKDAINCIYFSLFILFFFIDCHFLIN